MVLKIFCTKTALGFPWGGAVILLMPRLLV